MSICIRASQKLFYLNVFVCLFVCFFSNKRQFGSPGNLWTKQFQLPDFLQCVLLNMRLLNSENVSFSTGEICDLVQKILIYFASTALSSIVANLKILFVVFAKISYYRQLYLHSSRDSFISASILVRANGGLSSNRLRLGQDFPKSIRLMFI